MTSKQRAARLEEVLNRPEIKAITAECFREILRREARMPAPMIDHVIGIYDDALLCVIPTDESETENG